MICRICDSSNLHSVIDLGMQPNAGGFLTKDEVGKEPYYPLKVVFCENCHAAQLDYTVPKETMFAHHTYLSGTTRTLDNHFRDTAQGVDNLFFRDKRIKSAMDIGSNDGTQLKHYQNLGYNVLGVESCEYAAQAANDAGINTLHKFFNEQTAKDIGMKFDVINASGVFFHLEELHSVCDGIKLLLDDDGVFVVQFIYAKSMMDNGAFDQIYHEHLLYYTIETLEKLLNRHGLAAFDAYHSPIHGGSIIAYVGHDRKRPRSHKLLNMIHAEFVSGCNEKYRWEMFANKIEELKSINLKKLLQWKAEGKKVYGLGAPVKGNTLLNTFGITSDLIECLTEKNPLRKGLYAPGSHIPVVMEDEVPPPDCQYVLSWNFKNEILANNKELIEKGVEFYFPVST